MNFSPYKYGSEKEGVTLYWDLKKIFVDVKYFVREIRLKYVCPECY